MANAKKTSKAAAPPGREVLVQRLLQILAPRIGVVHAVNRSQGGDDGFARRKRGDQPDADLPVETQWLDRRLDGAPRCARQAVDDRRRMAVA